MAGNDWVNSYLEAILAVDPGLDKSKSKPSLLLRERGRFSPTRYFVEEVISGFDETDLYRSWIRASSTRSPQERNTRLENMCWRIWNLARKKKQIQSYQARYDAKRRIEQERARRDATADLSDLSEGEKGDPGGDGSTHGDHSKSRMSRINSMDAIEAWTNQQKDKKLYIVLISLHGLIRGKDMELGRDSDTGGQVKYVVELARALGSTPGVYRVDLLTRQIVAPGVDSSYGEPTEMLSLGKSDISDQDLGEGSGAYIVRIPFGPKDKYVAKELLWPYVQEFVDGALGHIVQVSKVLGDQIGEGQPIWPAAIHGHYADAGNSASLLAGALNVPMLFTGHSLGRDKLEQLLKQGRMSKEEIDATYKIMRRIEAEELCLDSSEIVITSTRQEIEEQWQLYEGFDIVLEKRLRARIRRKKSCHGRFMPRMYVIPPGMEFHNVPTHDGDADDGLEGNEDNKSSDTPIWSEVMRFFSNPRKPMILALARPDPKKNITTLVKAFGESRALQELANLTLIMGNRDDIDQMSTTSASVLISILKMVDKYDLYGQVAYPKHHKQSEVPDIYRLAAKTKGVFINPAFIEPFGLTLIEAAAHGLPFVATKNGGPVDINKVLDSGILIDPHNQEDIANALLTLLTNKQKWAKCRQNGLKNIHLFSWPEHCKNYLSRIALCSTRHPQWKSEEGIEENQDLDADSFRDSFRDSKGIYISLDDEKADNDNVESEDSVLDGGSTVEKTVMAFSKVMRSSRGSMSCDKADVCNDNRFPTLRRREHVIVIAVDTDLRCLSETIQNIFKSAGKDNSVGSIGFILSTGLTINETHSFLVSSGISPNDFDAFICSSGSQLFYPPSHMDSSSMISHDLPYVVDLDYDSQTEYRWGGVDLKKVLVTWAALVNEKCSGCKELLTVDEDREKNRCFAFKVKDPSLAPSVKEVRREMRRQGFRCHVIYSQKGDVLHIIPVLASRSQALRYLFLRWGIELKKMVVVVGESGDTDYEGLLGGVNKTIIVTGVGESNQRPAYANKGYALEDSATLEPPYVICTGGSTSDDIKAALEGLGIIES